MNWAQKRKLAYVMGVLLVLSGILSLVVHQVTKVPPTCYDKKQNQSEVGVDCGGPCTFYCRNELADPKLRWQRTFEIRPGIVHAVAYLEHTYPTAAARMVNYSFKLYDENNTLITERTGSTFLGTMGRTAIVETLIKTGNTKPAFVRFAFTPPIPWEKVPDTYAKVVIKTDKTLLEPLATLTRLTATLENTSRTTFRGVQAVAILYDRDDNAIAVSQALVPVLQGEGSQVVHFTWPFAMPVPVGRIEIIPRLNPFNSRAL